MRMRDDCIIVPRAAERRICFVTEALGAGGAERVISLLASRWAVAGWDVAICTFDAPGDPVYHPIDDRVRLLRLGTAGRDKKSARAVALLRRIARLRGIIARERPDMVLSFLTKINALTLVATIGTGVKVAVCERNNPARQNTHPLWNLVLNLLIRRADAIVAQTKRSIENFPLATRGKTRIIVNPIETPPGIPAAYDKEGMLRLVAVGRLTAQKGFDLLIEAFARVAPRNPEWCLDIWGEGPDRRTLEAMIRASPVPDRIALRGLSGIQGGWTEAASAFVLSSRYEGFPNALGEAMACGLPVIAFDCPYGPRELIQSGHNGMLVEGENIVALARMLERLMTTPWLRRALGENAAESAKRLATDRVARQWEGLVEMILRPRNGDTVRTKRGVEGAASFPGR